MIKQKYQQHKETIHNFGWRALQIGAKQGVTFLIFFIAVFYLSVNDIGIYSYLMTLVGLLMIVCDFGFSQSISKYFAEESMKKSKSMNKILFSISLVVINIAFVLSLLILFFGKTFFEEYRLLFYLIPYFFFLPLSSIADGVYRGKKQFKKLSIISIITGIISLIISFVLIKIYGLVGAIISQNIFFLLLTLGLYAFVGNLEFKFDKKIAYKILSYSITLGLINLTYFMFSRSDILFLKYFDFIKEIAYYEIVLKITYLAILPYIILGQVIAPDNSKLVAQKKIKKIKEKFYKYLFPIFISAIVLSAIIYLIVPIILSIFPKYNTQLITFILGLIIIVFPLRILHVFMNQGFLVPMGLGKYSLISIGFAGILNLFLNYIFISIWGFVGVIYASMICFALVPIFMYILISRYFHKNGR